MPGAQFYSVPESRLRCLVGDAAPFMGPAYWIPAFWVPALLVTHYIVFRLLGKRWVGRI
jgi:hypothetical protein